MRSVEIEDDLTGGCSLRGDERTIEHEMRAHCGEGSVFPTRRLAFGEIYDDDRLSIRGDGEVKFSRRWKLATTPPQEPARSDLSAKLRGFQLIEIECSEAKLVSREALWTFGLERTREEPRAASAENCERRRWNSNLGEHLESFGDRRGDGGHLDAPTR